MSRELHSTLQGRASSTVWHYKLYFTNTKIKLKIYRKEILIMVTMKIGNYQERQQGCFSLHWHLIDKFIFKHIRWYWISTEMSTVTHNLQFPTFPRIYHVKVQPIGSNFLLEKNLPVMQKQELIFPSKRGSSHSFFCSSVPYMWRTSMFPVSVRNQQSCLLLETHSL